MYYYSVEPIRGGAPPTFILATRISRRQLILREKSFQGAKSFAPYSWKSILTRTQSVAVILRSFATTALFSEPHSHWNFYSHRSIATLVCISEWLSADYMLL